MSGFNTAVTGLKSASTLLDVAGNNIANSSTVGFKSSRTEFADIYATSVVGAGSSNAPGSGVTVRDIAQDFSAGTIEFTNNNLDLAINGSGFFQLDDGNGGISFTRAGAFELDKDGFIVSKNGKNLQGYGLDALGNQLPLQDMAVTQKESPPKATEIIDLSFNINAANDPEDLSTTFAKTNPGSYSYSTTVETVDSLGNSNSIRFYFVEQAPITQVYRYNSDGTDPISLSEVDIPLGFDGSVPTDPFIAEQIEAADPRIIVGSVTYLPDPITGNGVLNFEVKSQSRGTGDFVVESAGADDVVLAPLYPTTRDSNEVRSYDFNTTGSLFSGPGDTTSFASIITVGGVDINIGTGQTAEDVADTIISSAGAIIDKNPDIEELSYNAATKTLEVIWKASSPTDLDSDFTITSSAGDAFVFEGTPGLFYDDQIVGDDTFDGNYRVYAYLNDEISLNIGKATDPGETGTTEVGPILVSFNTTNGALNSVNGESFSSRRAPVITILGADPANPDDIILDSDVDSLAGIQLDFTGASQFASESIVKSSAQDGYPKGDLIGVSFAETGEMVASFSNGQRQNLGLVAIASFENQSGLAPSGDTEWTATLGSGSAILNPPGTGLNGTLRSAALEQSNVDLSEELVKLIEGQRNFQASSKTLETLNTVTQAILQI